MWTQRLNLPMGPYPDQDANINAMDFYELYGPDDRQRMIEKTLRDGYTHAVTGPFYDAGGYHGRWPAQTDLSQRAWDHYLDAMQEWRDVDIIPVHFMSPDGWTLPACQAQLSALYAQPRAQDLLPIKVPHGWEPDRYGTSSRTWKLWADWAAEVSGPETLILAHTVCDLDALVGTDALYDDNGKGNDRGWQYVAPHFHGWLIQLCGFVDSGRDPVKVAQWRANLAAYFTDADSRFRRGAKGWPTGSRFGADVPLKLYYGEGSSYVFFHDPTMTEDEARSFGDLAMAHGADGYLDAGSVIVP